MKRAESLRGRRRFFAHYLVAQLQALVADPLVTGRCHGRDLIAALLAEAALLRPGLIAYLLDRGDGRAGRPPGFGYHRVHTAEAAVADVRVRPGDQLLDLLLCLPAERARQKGSRIGHSPTVFEQQQQLRPQDDGCRRPAHGRRPTARSPPTALPLRGDR